MRLARSLVAVLGVLAVGSVCDAQQPACDAKTPASVINRLAFDIWNRVPEGNALRVVFDKPYDKIPPQPMARDRDLPIWQFPLKYPNTFFPTPVKLSEITTTRSVGQPPRTVMVPTVTPQREGWRFIPDVDEPILVAREPDNACVAHFPMKAIVPRRFTISPAPAMPHVRVDCSPAYICTGSDIEQTTRDIPVADGLDITLNLGGACTYRLKYSAADLVRPIRVTKNEIFNSDQFKCPQNVGLFLVDLYVPDAITVTPASSGQ